MTPSRWCCALFALAIVSGFAVGCGQGGPPTYPLSGSVTWNGKPVPVGLIRLVPDADAGNPGPAAVAVIKEGRYATPVGKGIVGGKYLVTISGNDGVPIENQEEGIRNVRGRPLFVDVLQEVEFPRAAATHDFSLSAQ